MISFACKEIELSELIKCSFDLTKTDYLIFDFLMEHNEDYTVSEIAKFVKLERSSVQKAIRKLVGRELVFRKQINLERGGYRFYYGIKNKDEIKNRIETIIDGWHQKVKKAIKNWK